MSILVISSAHNPDSKVNIIASEIAKFGTLEFLNIATLDLPLCDGYSCYQNPEVIKLQKQINSATGFILCSPVYCYDMNAIMKNFIELCGQQLTNKAIGIAVSAGGTRSYMAPMSMIQSLMLDFRCKVVPRYVYLTSEDFEPSTSILKNESQKRLEELASSVVNLTTISL